MNENTQTDTDIGSARLSQHTAQAKGLCCLWLMLLYVAFVQGVIQGQQAQPTLLQHLLGRACTVAAC